MCLTAHGLAAALLLTKEFPLESLCEDSAFLAFFLRNFWNILFINSVGSTLVTTDVVSHVHPQAFHGWLLSCCVPAGLRGAAAAAPVVPQPETSLQHGAGRAAPRPCAVLYLPREHGSSTDLWLPSCGSGLQGGAEVPRWPVPRGGKGQEHGVDAGLQCRALPGPVLSLPGALPLSTGFQKYRVSAQFEEL